MPWHYMKGNRGSALPAQVLYLDTETSPQLQRGNVTYHGFDIGTTCYARWRPARDGWTYQRKRWTDPGELVDYIDHVVRGKTTLYVLGSNPTFDLWVLDAFRLLYDLGWRLSFFYDKGLTFILKAKRGKATIVVLAIQNYYPVSVKAIGEMVGLPKIDVDPLTVRGEERWRYCERDTEILRLSFERWLTFIGEHDMGGFALTRTGQAMRAYRHRYMTERILIHQSEKAVEWERAAYFGGRTECFSIGEFTDGPFVVADVHSMYPYMMQRMDFPYQLVNVGHNPDLAVVSWWPKAYSVVCHALVETAEPAYAVRRDGKTVFPVGRFWAWLCTPDLSYALAQGHLRAVNEYALYRSGRLFKTFIEDFYRIRREHEAAGEGVYSHVCKYILNGFYGKWGQRLPETVYEGTADTREFSRTITLSYETGERGILTTLLGKEWLEQGSVEGSNNAVAIAAHVTSGARSYLWSLLKRFAPHEVLYCDTDSLMLREAHIGRLSDVMHESMLGCLSVQKRAASVTLRGLKDYKWGSQDVIKGIRREAEYLGSNSYRQDMFPGLYSLLRDAPPGLFPIVKRTKLLKRVYDKGTVDPDSGRVSPLLFNASLLPANAVAG